MQDSFNFSNILINGRTRLFNRFDITFNSTYDPYIYENGKELINFIFRKIFSSKINQC